MVVESNRPARRSPATMRSPAPMRALAAATLACLAALATASAHAQELSDRATERCVRAAVRLQVDVTGPGGRRGTSTGSGTVIDPRGYVLTNFHVVGQTRWSPNGMPGSLLGDGQHVQVAMVESARDVARTRWIGRVVRGDVRLDLAIVRIVAQADGSPVPEGTVFPTVEIATTEGMQPGASLWAFGFPLGVRTINVTGGRTTGFQMNARGEVAWIRTDAEFNPGNSGGMLVDRRGRLVAVPTAVVSGDETLEPIELARPAERIPRAWLDALARGTIDDVRITGVDTLASGAEATATAVGDAGGLDTEPEIHFFALPEGRPATVSTTPAVPVALVSERGIVREGRGQLALSAHDPPNAMVAVLLPRPADGAPTEARLRVDVAAPMAGGLGVRTPEGVPPTGVPPTGVAPPYGGGAYGAGAYGGGVYGSRAAAGIIARGVVVDGRTGRPVPAVVLVARPGVDPTSAADLFLSGRLLPQQLESMLLTRGQSDPSGAYELRGLVPGTFATLVVAQGYRPTLVQVTIPASVPLMTLSPIQVFP
jgi:serine protease Do